MKPRIVTIVQARMGSSRLPGKVLATLAGEPMLFHVIQRALAIQHSDGVVVATTMDTSDDPVEQLALRCGVDVHRGSASDVLDRYYCAARKYSADIVVRVTADDPLKDPEVIDRIIARLLESGADYASNTVEPTYPEGLDAEVFTISALERAWRDATLGSDREHVTPYIWRQPELFRIEHVKHDADLAAMRWTVDYDADLQFVRQVYGHLYKGSVFGMREVLDLLTAEPAIAQLNEGVARNIGYQLSLAADAAR